MNKNICPFCGNKLRHHRCDFPGCGYKEKQLSLKITATDERSIVELPDVELDTLQQEIGGYIEVVRPCRLPKDMVMLVDEEGLCKDLSLNRVGSWLYGADLHGSPIAGDILILSTSDEPDEDFVGLDMEQFGRLLRVLLNGETEK